MKKTLAVIVLAFAAGCATSLPDLAGENQSNLVRLNVGMSKADVLKIMGQKTADTRDGPVANPFKVEMFRGRDGSQYEILHYVTQRNRRGHAVTVANATPIVLKDGVLLGWGSQTLADARMGTR